MNSINHVINHTTSRNKIDKKKQIITAQQMNHFETINREKNKLEAFYTKPKISFTLFDKFIDEKTEVNRNANIDVFDINDVYKRNIKKIYNVYQALYMDDIKVTGFGDFIRGCYFALDFCERFNIQFEIVLNHPISSFLNTHAKKRILHFENVKMFTVNNCYEHTVDANNVIHTITGHKINSEFISYLSKDASVHDDYALIYNLVYPQHEISEAHKEYMQRFLCPTPAMEQSICDTMTNLDIARRAYSVIHIRSGDNFSEAVDIVFQSGYINQLCKYINQIIHADIKIRKRVCKYLLISDNNKIKTIISSHFLFMKVINHPITHIATAFANKDEMVKNTLIDFYLMSRSNAIHSFSCYEHGSGFSQWCAKTYNIPFSCRLVKP